MAEVPGFTRQGRYKDVAGTSRSRRCGSPRTSGSSSAPTPNTDPRGSRQGLGALLLGYYDADGRLIYAGKVGTGFDGHMLRSLKAALSDLERDRPAFDRGRLPRGGVHWAEPRLVGQVAFTEWTQDGQLRHPRFLGLRTDKEPTEVVREEP